MTIEGLLTHASGMPQEPGIAYWSAPDFPFPTHEEIVAKVPTLEALYAPESKFQYSNIGFTLLGEIVAAASGQPYGAYAKEKILSPLGLTSTTPEIPASERGKRLAVGYSSRDREGRRQPLPFFTINAVAPAAGYASDVGDLGRFASWQFRLLASGGTEVLKATTLREMQRIHWAEPDFETLWGLGFHIWKSGDKILRRPRRQLPRVSHGAPDQPRGQDRDRVLSRTRRASTRRTGRRSSTTSWRPPSRPPSRSPARARRRTRHCAPMPGRTTRSPGPARSSCCRGKSGIAMLELPTMTPVKDLEKFKKTGEHRFRRIRKDESLGEEVVFEMGADGRPVRFVRHSNVLRRVKSPSTSSYSSSSAGRSSTGRLPLRG